MAPEQPGGRRRYDSTHQAAQGGGQGQDGTFADVYNAFSFTGGRKRRRREAEQSAWEDHQEQPDRGGRPQGRESRSEQPVDEVEEEAPAASIRSYTWTGGRTRSNSSLEMETLVSTSESCRPGAMLQLEHQSIAEICQHPRSVAEVGALLSVPIGVARVLLTDMAELGLITVHQTVTESGSAPHLMLMERVLSGLRRL